MIRTLKPKPINKKLLIKRLDIEFSLFIRLRNSINGTCKCVTCGKTDIISKMQCGHFISRGKFATRYDERNCNVQCYGCNVMQQGRQYEHALYINSLYGEGTSDLLLKLSKTTANYDVNWYKEQIAKYKKYNEKLK